MKHTLFTMILIAALMQASSGLCIDADEILDNVKKKYDKAESFTADYTQQFQWKLTGQVQDQNGHIILRGADQFRIETGDQTIVSDGKTLWTYSRLYEQVIVDDIQKAQEVVLPRELLLKFSKDYAPELLGEEIFEDQSCYVIQLNAKSDDVFIRQMKVWVKKGDWLTLKIEHRDLNENITTYIIRNIMLDVDITPDTFRYTPPEGTEVIDMR